MDGKLILLLCALAVTASAMPSPQQLPEGDSTSNEVGSSEEDLLDEMLEYMSEGEVIELLVQESDQQTVEAVSDAILRRTERDSYGGCFSGPRQSSPFCNFLRLHISNNRFGGSGSGSGSSSGGSSGSSSQQSSSGSSQTFGSSGGDSGSDSSYASFGGSGPEPAARGGSGSGSGPSFGSVGGGAAPGTSYSFGGSDAGNRGGSGGASFGSQGSSTSFEQSGSSSSFGSSGSSGGSSGSGSSSGGASFGAGAGGRFGGVNLEASHDECQPPVTHIIREAVEYLPKTIYNTQHLILPSTRVLTMVETENYPQPVYETVTSVIAMPDKTITATVLQATERTLDVNSARATDVLLRSTKLHIFTDTKDYFWTRTEVQPFYETVTLTTTSDVQTDYSHKETRYEDHTVYVTTTLPHIITQTSTASSVVRTYVTETAHQYRYVAVTPVPVTVTETVTHCYP